MYRIIPLVVLVVALPSLASAQGRDLLPGIGPSSSDRFRLSNECAPIDLLVEGLDDAAAYIGLTKERIQTLAESRLRAARLYDAEAEPCLYVRVGVMNSENVRGGAFIIEISFRKYLYDAISEHSASVETWATGGFGTHNGDGDDADFILQSLSEYFDRFVLEYLRVNEAACTAR